MGIVVEPSMLMYGVENIPDSVFVNTEELTLADRCDSCNAAAYVRALKDGNQLLFCGNHARRNIVALTNTGWHIDDQTSRIKQ